LVHPREDPPNIIDIDVVMKKEEKQSNTNSDDCDSESDQSDPGLAGLTEFPTLERFKIFITTSPIFSQLKENFKAFVLRTTGKRDYQQAQQIMSKQGFGRSLRCP